MAGGMARRQDFFVSVDGGAVRLAPRQRGPQFVPDGPPFHVSGARDGGASTQFYRIGRDYLLRFPGLADFTVSADGREASCRLARGVSMTQVEHLWLNQVAPLARSKQGEMVFHGSCVEIGGRAVAFIGESGRGKSTLAAAFASRGHAFLTDDGLILRRSGGDYIVCPSHPSIRLWPDSRAALALNDAAGKVKSMIRAGDGFNHGLRPLPLAALYFLENDAETVLFARLSPRDIALRLLENSFLLDIEDRDLLSAHFRRTAAFANWVNGFRLDYPRRFEALESVRAAIVAKSSSQARA